MKCVSLSKLRHPRQKPVRAGGAEQLHGAGVCDQVHRGYSTVLYCTVLYCTVLYCTVLFVTRCIAAIENWDRGRGLETEGLYRLPGRLR